MLEGCSNTLKEEFLHPKNLGKLKNPDSWSRITGVCGERARDELLSKEPITEPHRTIVDETAQRALEALKAAFEKAIEKELQN